MQRFNFQFTGQRFYTITDGQLVGQVRDVAYQATTTDFWGSMEAVGGESTWRLQGAFNCGKAQPGQVAAYVTDELSTIHCHLFSPANSIF